MDTARTPARTRTRTRSALAVGGSLAVVAALAWGGSQAASATGGPDAWASTVPAATSTTAPTSDVASLAFNREEERMARDLYAAIAEHYDGAAPFAMITRSEQQHFAAVGTLLERYGVTDPSAGRAAGTYADPAIQKLYDGWLKRAMTSLDEAYRVGVELEQRDIADLDRAVAASTHADVTQVLGRLRAASQHHLAAFTAAASGDRVTGGPLGRGPGAGAGRGMGAGSGMGAGMGAGMGGSWGAGAGDGVGDMPCLDADTTT